MTRRKHQGLARALAALPPAKARAHIAALGVAGRRDFRTSWADWAEPGQIPPAGKWRVWLMMAGRGFGKTRAGAEWICGLARDHPGARIALVSATMDEARAVMVEGESGLLSVAQPEDGARFEPSLSRVSFRNGARARLFSAENFEGLRGPQHRFAWCDELGKWGAAGEHAWHNLMMGLRDGPDQRVLVTTTPRPTPLLRRLIGDPAVRRTGGRTRDNLHLPEAFVESMDRLYAGTRLGRQELDGELLTDIETALWTRAMIEGCRAEGRAPDLVRVVVAVDPPASDKGDACGIVGAGLDEGGIGHVLDDATVERASPAKWAAAVAACAARHGADRVIAEANNGGDMVLATLRAHDRDLPVKLVRATRGKAARAEPVALLYEQGRVRHARPFPALEDQLCGMTATGYQGPTRSPDRADALVWALTELMLGARGLPRVRVV